MGDRSLKQRVGRAPAHAPRVLVVDDDPVARLTIGRVVERCGLGSVAVASGPEALQALQDLGFDAVVSDLCMPGMSGTQLLRRIRQVDPDLPVLFATGQPTLESAIEAVELGAFHYMRKPVDPAELGRVLSRATRTCRLTRLKRQALDLGRQARRAEAERSELLAHFERALDGLYLAWQPLVRAGGRLAGYEALLRTGDARLPDAPTLLAAAEQLGRTELLGRQVRRRAALDFTSRPAGERLFLNLHPSDLMDDDLLRLDCPLASQAERVVLEVTERSALGNLHVLRRRVDELRALGFSIAVDDLGAGYAGLASFVSLQPDVVKIDMSLVRGIHEDELRRSLVRSIVNVCGEMHIEVVAEGIEQAAEHEVLLGLGVDLLQGYYYARPGPPFPSIAQG